MAIRTLELDLGQSTWRCIEHLAAAIPGLNVEGFIAVLLDHVRQGVCRPDSWEREWLASVVGAVVAQHARKAATAAEE